MSTDGKLESSKAQTIYEILRRLGIKTVGNDAGRPNFPKESEAAKTFYWRTQRVFGKFWKGEINRDAAITRTLSLTDEYGPLIWGHDRSNLVSAHVFREYPKELRWDEGKAVEELYVKSVKI
jgi:hypothetical protein